MAPTSEPMPKPLSRTQFVTVRLPIPPEPAVAARAPISPQSIGLLKPVNLKNPAKLVHQCDRGTYAAFTKNRKPKTTASIVHAKYSSILSTVPPNERMKTTATISAVAVHARLSRSDTPANRPAHALIRVAAAL